MLDEIQQCKIGKWINGMHMSLLENKFMSLKLNGMWWSAFKTEGKQQWNCLLLLYILEIRERIGEITIKVEINYYEN